MVDDALREALSATRDAWQAVNDEFPADDPDAKAAVLLEVDDAWCALEDAIRLAAIRAPE